MRILPCEWNVQFHARINTIIECLPAANISGRNLTFAHIPLNCPQSELKKIFACNKKAKVLHFMAQSYKEYISEYLLYYSSFWRSYNEMSWEIASGS